MRSKEEGDFSSAKAADSGGDDAWSPAAEEPGAGRLRRRLLVAAPLDQARAALSAVARAEASVRWASGLNASS